MSETINVIVLAVVQGLTEFLPVSSSGHLAVAQHLLGFTPPGLSLEIILHAGTLLAVLLFYRKRIIEIVLSFDWRYAAAILLSMIPAGIGYKLFKAELEAVTANMTAVGACLMFTGFVLCLTAMISKRRNERAAVTWLDAVIVGSAQAVAMLPGVSRSGSTISTARLLGIEPAKAAEFSFLMLVPVIAGAALLDLKDLVKDGTAGGPSATSLLLGAAVAAVVGYGSILGINRILHAGRFWWFGVYCLVIGAAVVVFL